MKNKRTRNVVVSLEHRFYSYENSLYTNLAFSYTYWKDYLSFFNEVTIVARAKPIQKLEQGMVKVDGVGVKFIPLPYYIGLFQFITKLPALISIMLNLACRNKFFLLRSGNISNVLWVFLFLFQKPYLREYPGNIKEGIIGFAGNSLKVRILANFLHIIAKFQSRFSKANSFVSQYCCELYASKKPSFIFSSFKASEINIEKIKYEVVTKANIVSVGRLEGEKGHIKLLESIKNIPNTRLHLVGDGSQRKALEDYVVKNNLDVIFYGSITDRQKLFSILKNADIFVIPSLTEGMPRALLEAMAIGLACLGANVGGIPEVLTQDTLYSPHDHMSLESKLNNLIGDQSLREKLGLRNKEFIDSFYSDEALQNQKHQFWSKLYE